MGLTNLPLGVSGAVALLIVPQLLSAAHVPEPRIAEITGLALLAGFACVPLSPILDVRFSRKTYAIVFTLLTGVLTTLSLLELQNLAVLGWLLFATLFSVSLVVAAAGGWLGSLVAKTDDTRLGSWLTVANISGFGVTAIVGTSLIRALPPGVGAVVLGLLAAAPALVCLLIPGPPPDRRLASESFGRFFGDVAALVRRPSVLLTALLFIVPAASFALTNTLGGLGHDYAASERFVSLAGGAGVTVAGVIGSLLAPRLADRMSARVLYLAIGAIGALFTLALIVLPHTPTVFLLAMMGENIAQSAALATANVVIFRTMGKDNPLAATEFAVLTAAVTVPITYMQVIDGHAYGSGGLPGIYLTDAGLGLAACAAMALVLSLTRRKFAPAAA
ncbi:MAG: putative rane protein [Phenylobacterium sp.]|jgi:PAT family beta-lactamase induction signal transducer AmpG|nr:putative rane protein [Phenylobacterium sp.]